MTVQVAGKLVKDYYAAPGSAAQGTRHTEVCEEVGSISVDRCLMPGYAQLHVVAILFLSHNPSPQYSAAPGMVGGCPSTRGDGGHVPEQVTAGAAAA